ncbi:MAG: type II toxin-antitoxin system Xre/ParS family antitoxin [Pseudomonadota bacterium]
MPDHAPGFAEAAGPFSELDQLMELFGGPKVLKRHLSNPIEAHEMILEGIPSAALERFVIHLTIIGTSDVFEKGLGMSERTFQRHKADRSGALSPEQSSRAWSFARILARAAVVFGSQEEAEKWMIQPAMGLDRQRPIDLLATAAGRELVQEFLGRIHYGVYT